MISVEEALERILAEITPLIVTVVPLPESLGYVLAEDVISQEMVSLCSVRIVNRKMGNLHIYV